MILNVNINYCLVRWKKTFLAWTLKLISRSRVGMEGIETLSELQLWMKLQLYVILALSSSEFKLTPSSWSNFELSYAFIFSVLRAGILDP